MEDNDLVGKKIVGVERKEYGEVVMYLEGGLVVNIGTTIHHEVSFNEISEE